MLYFINFINIEKLEDFIIIADSLNLKIKIIEKNAIVGSIVYL